MKHLSKILYTLLITATFSLKIQASVMYCLGTYVPYFKDVQTDTSGNKQFFTTNPYLGIGSPLKMSEDFYFVPEFGYVYYTSNPTNLKRDVIMLHYNFSYVVTEQLLVRAGLTTNWMRLKGEGGEQNLKNGSGSRDFDSPDATVTSYFTTWDLGFEAFIDQQLSFRFDYQIMNIKQFEDRQYNYVLSVNIYR